MDRLADNRPMDERPVAHIFRLGEQPPDATDWEGSTVIS
jgi:hypothetical protein